MKTTPILSLLSAFGCSDASLKVINSSPEAVINYPAEGDALLEQFDQLLLGRVSDVDHSFDELTVRWFLGSSERICEESVPDEAGDVFCEIKLGLDVGSVRLEVIDDLGGLGDDSVSFTILPTAAPSVEIIRPENSWGYYTDQLTTFEGRVSDEEDAAELLVAVWESSIDGTLIELDTTPNLSGEVLGFGTLSEGEHAITLTVTDTSGKQATDSVIVQVGPPNTTPSCEITAPEPGSEGVSGAVVSLESLALDADVPSDWLEVVWTSNVDGDLGRTTPASTGESTLLIDTLSGGTHTLTMTVNDELGASCSDDVVYSVQTPPNANIGDPADGALVQAGESLGFAATVSDAEDPPDALSVQWSSSLDGSLDTTPADTSGAAIFSTESLSPGEHTVTLTVTDSSDLIALDTVRVIVNGQPSFSTVTITTADDQVRTSSELTCTATATDPEGDIPDIEYVWTNSTSATTLDAGSEATTVLLTPATARPHDTIVCTAVATDADGGSSSATDAVEVVNTAPAAPTVAISPASPNVLNDLVCSISAASDPDEDALTYDFEWSVDGASSAIWLTAASESATLTVPASDTNVDQVWTCTVSAHDGTSAGPSGSAGVTITTGEIDCGDGIMGLPIATCENLQAMAGDLTETYCLTDDVDCSDIADFASIEGEFTGRLLGFGYTISGFESSGTGLFVLLNGEVRDLNLSDVFIFDGADTGVDNVGTIAGSAGDEVHIEAVHVSGRLERTFEGEDTTLGGLVGRMTTTCSVVEASFTGQLSSEAISTGGLIGRASQDDLTDGDCTVSDGHVDATITGTSSVGGILGTGGDRIEYSSFTGEIRSTGSIGGITGAFGLEGVIQSCAASGTFTGGTSGYVGGLAGYSNGHILDSYSTVEIIAADPDSMVWAGGLVGYQSTGFREGTGHTHGSIERSYATGNVSAATAGGLIGVLHQGDIVDSYALGDVDAPGHTYGTQTSGGLIGFIGYSSEDETTIVRSFSAGAVTGGDAMGSYNGGLIARSTLPYTLTNAYWDTDTSGCEDSDSGEGYSSAEMTTAASFLDWNFTDIWIIDEGLSYPCLRWQGDECRTPE